MSSTDTEAGPDTLSSDATHSTYTEADDVEETNPPSGPSVVQERGVPAEASPTKASTKSSSTGASTS